MRKEYPDTDPRSVQDVSDGIGGPFLAPLDALWLVPTVLSPFWFIIWAGIS